MVHLSNECLVRGSQLFIVTQQLNDGIRMLQMQAHNQSGIIQLCHSTCVCSLSPTNYFINLTIIIRLFTMAAHYKITLIQVLNLFLLKLSPTHKATLLVKAWMDENPTEGTLSPYLRHNKLYRYFSKCFRFLLSISTILARLLMMLFSALLDLIHSPLHPPALQ